jgi:hypothetical protein
MKSIPVALPASTSWALLAVSLGPRNSPEARGSRGPAPALVEGREALAGDGRGEAGPGALAGVRAQGRVLGAGLPALSQPISQGVAQAADRCVVRLEIVPLTVPVQPAPLPHVLVVVEGQQEVFEATTGVPQESASIEAKPKVSCSVGAIR